MAINQKISDKILSEYKEPKDLCSVDVSSDLISPVTDEVMDVVHDGLSGLGLHHRRPQRGFEALDRTNRKRLILDLGNERDQKPRRERCLYRGSRRPERLFQDDQRGVSQTYTMHMTRHSLNDCRAMIARPWRRN